MPFTLHPDIEAAIAAITGGQAPPPSPQAGDVAARRALMLPMWQALMANVPTVSDVEIEYFNAYAADGYRIQLRWFKKKAHSPGSAVLFIHGGGMIAHSGETYQKLISHYVSESGTPFLAVDYRLAPEARAPTLVHDAYAALVYLSMNASNLGVDPLRIGIFGDSAGAGIAASLAYYAKQNKGWPFIKKQILLYPMLDDRNLTIDPETAPFSIPWTVDDNKTGWGALLNGKEGSDEVDAVDAPSRMTVEDARGLPPTYIDIGQLDIFASETLEFVQKLGKAGVDCEFHLIPSMPHVFDAIAPKSAAVREVLAWRVRAIQSI